MNVDLWRKVEGIFRAALERTPDERKAFVDGVCGADTNLRRQVERLLAREAQAGSFLQAAATKDTALTLSATGSVVDRHLGSYRILSLLGAGGMGEVYRAHDDKLGRDVAIKMLSHEFVRDPERLSRLRREARTLASLNHPNIAAIYGLEESEDVDYLVLELVEGKMLRGPLPVQTALDRASQLVAALQAAHEKGIIHCDLKPANVMVTPQGRVKVLDFGLAKAIWGTESNQDLSKILITTGEESVAGQIVGTPGYMSPEQARGRDVDKRTDIWAFGCLLYELLTGKRAFRGETVRDTIAAVLEREPNWQALPTKTPAQVRELLRQCLQKDVGRRLPSMDDVHRTIEKAQRGSNHWRVAAIAAAILAMFMIGVALWIRGPTRLPEGANPAARIQSLAVLPLENLSGDPEQEYFSEGMTEALITELGKVQTPRVISRQSVMRYKGSNKPLPEIASELKVDAILVGAVERFGDRVRVSVHLDQGSPERQLWSEKYDRSISDVLVLQDEIARAVTDEIQAKLTPQERTRLASAHPVDPKAQDAFLRGQFFTNKGTEREVQAGIGYFREAIEKNPEYAPAYAGLASALLQLGDARWGGHSTTEVLPEARVAAAKALALDPSLEAAHTARAWIQLLAWNWPEAEKEFQLALKLGPNSVRAHESYALYLMDVGRFDEAKAQIHYTIELDPLSPEHRGQLAFVAFCSRQYDLALEEFKNAGNDHGLARTYAAKKMYPEAIAAVQRLESNLGRRPMVVSDLAWAYGLAGRTREAQKFISELNEIARHRYVAPVLFMTAYIGLGDNDKALTWLERGYEEHDAWLVFLKIGPTWDPLRSEPRFQAVLRRMNFPQ